MDVNIVMGVDCFVISAKEGEHGVARVLNTDLPQEVEIENIKQELKKLQSR